MCMAPQAKEPQRRTFRITWENGNVTTTGMNATLKTATAYFTGQKFQFGDTDEHPGDLLLAAVKVEEVLEPNRNAYEDEDDLGEEYCNRVGCHACEGTMPESSEPNGYGCDDQEKWVAEHAHLITGPVDPCANCADECPGEGCDHAKEEP